MNLEIIKGLEKSTQAIDMTIKDLNQILSIRDVKEEAKEKVYFDKIMADIKQTLHDQIIKTNTQIDEDFTDAPHLHTLKGYIHSIIYNLVNNAIKYRQPNRSPHITIHSKQLKKNIYLSITDNGIGIDLHKNKDKIFGLYKRFHTQTHKEGKGLGLYLVKSQVESLGGKIEVESKVGLGTTFSLHLPQNLYLPSTINE